MIRHPKVAEAVALIAGRFKVLRIEVGGCRCRCARSSPLQLERFLEKIGVDYTFPTADKVAQQQGLLRGDDGRVRGVQFPDQGVLLVVDEFLEYLQSAATTNWCRTWPSCGRSAKSPST